MYGALMAAEHLCADGFRVKFGWDAVGDFTEELDGYITKVVRPTSQGENRV